jgi:hypothetical protein
MESKQEEPKPIHEQIIDAVGGEDRFKEIAGLKRKQETLEEAIIRVSICDRDEFVFKAGAKWQAERMYSEEDIINALHSVELKDNKDYSKIYKGMKEWFEQFKKK